MTAGVWPALGRETVECIYAALLEEREESPERGVDDVVIVEKVDQPARDEGERVVAGEPGDDRDVGGGAVDLDHL